jgi:tRNA dimethylallyltransferase
MESPELIVIVGPTAVGKTGLALRLAERLNTEIVSADSRQVFRELQIGTAKPAPEELRRINHHFISTRSVEEGYDAGTYGRDALLLLDQLFNRYRRVILCGGSGLYIKAVCEGMDDFPEIAPGIRGKIVAEYNEKGLAWLQRQVEKLDPEYFSYVDRQNPHRLVRALELIEATGKTVGSFRMNAKQVRPFRIRKIGLEVERDILYQRIDKRIEDMVAAGLFAEAEQLFPLRHLNALQTVGYREIFAYREGKYDRLEAIRLLKQNSRNYAKRQLTWFKKDEEVRWFHPGQADAIDNFIGI